MDDPTGSDPTVPDALGVEAQLRRLVRHRLGCEPESSQHQLDEGARAWAVGRKPRAARRQLAAR